jgi:sulfoxide reductase catalytic subunit YedY
MLIKQANDIKPSEITSESVYLNRRKFLHLSGMTIVGGIAGSACDAQSEAASDGMAESGASGPNKSPFSTDEAPNSYQEVTTYNNYYEFGTGKEDPYNNAQAFRAQPWKVTVSGHCDKPGSYHYEDIVGPHSLEERVYRLRCVEAWSMVIPWMGLSLADLLKRFEPNSDARFVKFKTLHDPEQMPGQRRRVLAWPYVEGLTMAEAMNPLPMMVTGLFGKELPNQNGAPLRLIVPWKYGFKSIKGINSIEFTKRRPITSWENAAADEYGFYANVNPEVSHPRWSQARERRIGTGLFTAKQPTLMFNGYGEQVAHLYAGLNLRKNY